MVFGELYSVLQKDDLCLSYSGVFSDTMTDKIIDLSSVYLEQNPELNSLRKRTSFLVTECFQNVVRHGSSSNSTQSDSLSFGSFLIRFRENKCFIASKNEVPHAQVDNLQQKIQEINSHDKNELKALYKNILTEGRVSEKGGAGLGLIEMARKTDNKLHYCFNKKNDEYCDFYLMLILEQKEEHLPNPVYISELNSCIDIFRKQIVLNQLLLFHGDFGNTVINPVIDMIQNTMDSISTNMVTRMKLYLVAIEMMHNINYYSYSAEGRSFGMLTVGIQNDSPMISAHFKIRLSSKSKMEKILKSLKNSSPEDLDSRYSKKLKLAGKNKRQNNWIGLIELSRIIHSWNYQIEDDDENLCSLGFHVTI
jgi:hypothetical protein